MKVATSRQLFKELICLKTRAFRTSFTKMAKLSNNFEGPESQTRVIKFDSGDDNMECVLKEASSLLKDDKIISVPTDTIYGLAGLAQSTKAINRIYEIKSRNQRNPIAICVGEVKDIHKWGKVTVSGNMLQELLPGPVTLIFERTLDLNPSLNPGTSLVGIRVPNHDFVRKLAQMCGEPLALTSANISTQPSTLSVQEFKQLWPSLDLVVDGGVIQHNSRCQLGSTVVDLSRAGKYTIIRPGSAHQATTDILKKYGLSEEQKG